MSQQRRSHVQPEFGAEKAFGEALRQIRKGQDVSQEHLGLEAGLDRTYVSLIERGIKSPTIRTLVKLADVLHVLPSEIVSNMEGRLGLSQKSQRSSQGRANPK